MKITFLDCTKTQYNGHTLKTNPLGGIESTTVALAEAFVKKGHDVCVINQNKGAKPQDINGVYWSNYDVFDFNDPINYPDIVIANNDAPLLERFPKEMNKRHIRYVLWLHNPVKLFKTIKKNRMATIIKKRPVAVFLGEEQKKNCSALHPFKERLIIPHGLAGSFLSQKSAGVPDRGKQAIFFSQAYRGFKEVADLWVKYISNHEEGVVLKAYVGDIDLAAYGIEYTREELKAAGIYLMPKVEKSVLIEDLKKSRCMIYPGHKDETFCVAALEANAMGVPIITYGRGSLSERVIDGVNGFLIEDRNEKEVANRALELLNNDELFHALSRNSAKHVESMTWDEIANQWEKYVFKNS